MKKKSILWDLTDVYKTEDCAIADSSLLKALAKKFVERFKGKIQELNFIEFPECIDQYEQIQVISDKLESYSELLSSTNLDDERLQVFCANLADTLREVEETLVFFELEMVQIPEQRFKHWCIPITYGQASYLKTIRANKDYLLPEEIEKTLVKQSFHTEYWIKLYHQILNEVEIKIGRKTYNLEESLGLMLEENSRLRLNAGSKLNEALKQKSMVLTSCLNALVKDKQTADEQRGYKTPVSAANFANQVKDEDVEAMTAAVVANYGKITHRYYEFKAKCLGFDKLSYWDRSAPYGISDNQKYSFSQAKNIVSRAFEDFSPEFNAVAQTFFNHPWIDVYPRKGKQSGCYCAPMVVGVHPYLFLNHQDMLEDVLTLAHEVGHGVHETLNKTQGHLGSQEPLALAELASIFGENLVFNYLLKNETNPINRFRLLATKIEGFIGTAFRQIMLHRFELKIHQTALAEGILTTDKINEIFLAEMKDGLGEAFDLEDADYAWSYIEHFFETPFYVYSYCLSFCLVNSLFEAYREGKVADFTHKYMQLLKNGAIKSYDEALADFGIDVKSPDFWDKGLSSISSLIDELESLKPQVFE